MTQKTKKVCSRLWRVYVEVTPRTNWIFKKIQLRDKNANAILVSKKALSKIQDANVRNCLTNMNVEYKQYKIASRTIKEAHITCDDIKFVCTKDPKKKWPNDVRLCEEQMCKGKCPYQIAKKLFPNAYKENQR